MIPPSFLRGSRPRCAVSLGSLALLLLTGCVSTNRTALAPAAQSQLKSVAVTATVSQPEIAADVDPSNVSAVTGGGLIGALIDVAIEAKRSKTAENTITPVRDALVDFSAPEALREALAAEMQTRNAPLPVIAVTLAEAKDDAAALKLARANTSDAVLVLSIDYRLSPEFDRIRVLAKVRLLPTKPGKDNPDQPLYQNEFATYRRLPAGADRGAPVTLWAANHGARAREALKSCFAEIAAMTAFDLKQGAEANLLPKESLTVTAPAAGRMARVVRGIGIKGANVHHDGDRSWVRLQTGELSSTE